MLLSHGLPVNRRSDMPAVLYGYSRVVLTGRVRRKEKSFYGAERAIDEKLIRDRYQQWSGLIFPVLLSAAGMDLRTRS